MIGLSDILSALKDWPLWKRIHESPDRLDTLEARVRELEKKLQEPLPGEACPGCGMRSFRLVTSERADPLLSKVWEKWRCERTECAVERTINAGGRGR